MKMKICLLLVVLSAGCSKKSNTVPVAVLDAPAYFKVDAASAGSISGKVKFAGPRPRPQLINMEEDPACVMAHAGKAYDESLVVDAHGALGNAFVYISRGLEGKNFETPTTPVVIDQRGCWFRPRLLGLQTGQTFKIVNSDPVTHNIHPMAMVNREWNHSQGPGDDPMTRRFIKPEIMIPVKCNIHSWMHAYIGVLDHPYFAVTKDDGSFEIKNLPAGTYTISIWQEKLGTQEQQITVAAQTNATANFTYKGKS